MVTEMTREIIKSVAKEKLNKMSKLLDDSKYNPDVSFKYVRKEHNFTGDEIIKLKNRDSPSSEFLEKTYVNLAFSRLWYEYSLLDCSCIPDLLIEVNIESDQPEIIVHALDLEKLHKAHRYFDLENEESLIRMIYWKILEEAHDAFCMFYEGEIDEVAPEDWFYQGALLQPFYQDDVICIEGFVV